MSHASHNHTTNNNLFHIEEYKKFNGLKPRIDRVPCPDCGSSDAVSIYLNKTKKGHWCFQSICFSCGEKTLQKDFKKKGFDGKVDLKNYSSTNDEENFFNNNKHLELEEEVVVVQMSNNTIDSSKQFNQGLKNFKPIEGYIPDDSFRGIKPETFEFFSCSVTYDDPQHPNTITKIIYPFFDHKDPTTLVAQKIRDLTRDKHDFGFNITGSIEKGGLFGSHVFIPSNNNNKYLTILEGECFTDSTEILTDVGFLSFPTLFTRLRGGEDIKVGQVDSNGVQTFVEPLALIEKDYVGDLVRIKTRGYESLTTPNHRLVFQKQNGEFVKMPAISERPKVTWRVPRTFKTTNESHLPLSDDEISLMLAISADAKMNVSKRGKKSVHLSFLKQRKKERLRGLLERLNIPFTSYEQKREGYTSFNINTMPDFISDFRMLPWELVTKTSDRQKNFILQELIFWDGNYVPRRNQIEYSSKHFWNISVIQAIAHSVGVISTPIHRKNQFGEWYKLSILFGKKDNSTQAWGKRRSIEQFKGKVYCVSVPSGMLVVRQGGYISVSGNCDALSAWQMLGGKYPCVSVKNGASALTNEVKRFFDYVNAFQEIRICMDPDKPGIEAIKRLCDSNLIPYGKLKIIRLNDNIGDVNDYLTKGKQQDFVKAFWNAEDYQPEGVVLSSTLQNLCLNPPKVQSFDYPFETLNTETFGMRLGEFDVFGARSGIGKTSLLKEFTLKILRETNEKVGLVLFEEPNFKTLRSLVGMQLGKRIDIPGHHVSKDEFVSGWEALGLQDNRVALWDVQVNSWELSSILKHIEFMVATQDIKFLFVDFLQCIKLEEGSDQERLALDRIAETFAKLAVSKNIHVSSTVQLNRATGEIRGSSGIEQFSYKIVFLERDKKHKEERLRRVTRLTIDKNRFNGTTGPGGFLEFNKDTGRLFEVFDIDDETFEGKKKKDEK